MFARGLDPRQRALRPALAEFVHAMIRPSLAGLLGTLGVAAGLLIVSMVAITPGLISSSGYGYFVNDPDDFWAQETTEVLRLAASPPHGPCVILIGASTLREAFSTPVDLEKLLTSRTGRRVEVHDLAMGGLTHWEALAIVDLLAQRHEGVVVLEISPRAIARPADFLGDLARIPRLQIESPAWNEEIRQAGFERPASWGNFFLDHYRFFLARPAILLNVVLGPVAFKTHWAEGYRQLTPQELEDAIARKSEWMATYEEHRAANLEVYERLARRAAREGKLDLVLLEAIRHPLMQARWEESPQGRMLLQQYRNDVTALAERLGLPYLDLQAEARPTEADFVDAAHIWRDEARLRFTEALAAHLAARPAMRSSAISLQRKNGS